MLSSAGSYGALPKVVTEACNELMAWQEENTDFYYRIGFIPPLIGVREQLAQLVGASDVDELVMVPNASTGVGVVLRNFLWQCGDTIIRCKYYYPPISLIMAGPLKFPPMCRQHNLCHRL